MYCTDCGKELSQLARYCSQCGRAVGTTSHLQNRLSRPREGKILAGVCAAFARHLDVDVTIVRVVWVLLTIFPPVPGIILYIIFWIVMPKDPLPQNQTSGAASQQAHVTG